MRLTERSRDDKELSCKLQRLDNLPWLVLKACWSLTTEVLVKMKIGSLRVIAGSRFDSMRFTIYHMKDGERLHKNSDSHCLRGEIPSRFDTLFMGREVAQVHYGNYSTTRP